MTRGAALAAALCLLGGGRAGGQSPAVVAVRTDPSVPPKGSVAWLTVGAADAADSLVTGIDGEAAGEPLHFSPAGGAHRALVAAPLEDGDSLALVLRIHRAGRTDTTHLTLALAQPVLGAERLRVPPRMTVFDDATEARIERERAESRAISTASHGTRRLWSAPFRLPRRSRITSSYGTAREYNGQITSRHLGTDFAGAVGAPVAAAARGVVALVADFYLAGRAVYLDHGEGLVTGYFHLSRSEVARGDTVAAGQTIGRVGRSGRVTGPHLHWIARYGTITVDPMSLVALPVEPRAGSSH